MCTFAFIYVRINVCVLIDACMHVHATELSFTLAHLSVACSPNLNGASAALAGEPCEAELPKVVHRLFLQAAPTLSAITQIESP